MCSLNRFKKYLNALWYMQFKSDPPNPWVTTTLAPAINVNIVDVFMHCISHSVKVGGSIPGLGSFNTQNT